MIIRHGDVLLVRIGDSKVTTPANKPKTVVVAEGEATGHAHRVIGNGIKFAGGVLDIPAGAEIRHEEHKMLVLEPGRYEVRRQTEWVSETRTVRQVRD